ncbi:hypothetical protein Caci_2960 [Catenulispora acidiphila DSM 44928]|uniref:Uncharacterized protein n=1 Tax=Catenulispora acidiphila (strain DSM 44928 / JCM 14897 / NBRC 102108 / NRRL B-24433 / ID139908) TaxID=479433 RepID=C7Q2X7_CATAD|nr:hypothetical protein [Catenulispora acidiphila]ACU71869.1 hypothetical protein Caci_2960 [Catenulispora acidiphila DSM 44928]
MSEEHNPILAASTFDAERLERLLAENIVDSALAVTRARYAPFQATYDAAFDDWERMMDASGLPDPMGTYAVLNIHYPQILDDRGFVGCMHCGVPWRCPPFAGLAVQELT